MSAEPRSKERDPSLFDAEISGQVLNLRLFARLGRWLWPGRLLLTCSAILVLLASLFTVLMEVMISRVLVDYIILGETDSPMPDLGMIQLTIRVQELTGLAPVYAAGLLFAVITSLAAWLGHLHRTSLVTSIVRALRDLRQDLFAHLERRPLSFYDRVPVGRVMTRVTNDVEALYEMLRGLGSLVGEFVPFLVALVIMFSTSVRLTLILLLLLPLVALAAWFFRLASQKVFRQVRSSVSALNHNLQENLSGMQVVQLSRREARNFRDYTQINRRNRRFEYKSINLTTVYGAFNDSLAAAGLGIIIWYGGGQVVQQEMTLGGVILFTRFMGMLFTPIVMLGEQLNVLFRAMASGERIFQALDWQEQIHEPTHPKQLPRRLSGRVEFRNLRFAYQTGEPVLEDVSVVIPAGSKLAIVGATGSGKSTMIRLLARFYDIPSGMIFLDGMDINDLHSRDVRSRMGIVLQDFHIFSGTIYDNIQLGDPRVSREAALQAAKTVNADTFVQELPDGYASRLAERGANLSQGQRQLLAFARVLAADPEILVLDEATASIDTETEQLIQEALHRLTLGRTCILVAHRLQTIQEADHILVLQEGRAAEYGTHEELLAKKGHYHSLYELQFQRAGARP